jgi:TonB family protein
MTHASISCVTLGLLCVLVASCAGPTSGPAVSSVAIGRYGHTLHDRFYEAWQQPASVALPPGKISVPVDVTIDSTGRVLNFRIVKSSGNERIDSSIAAVGKTVTRVAPPPDTTSRKPFKLRIYFELDVASSRGG